MPDLINYSAFNRDEHEYLSGFEQELGTIDILENSLNKSKHVAQFEHNIYSIQPDEDNEISGFDFNKALDILRNLKGKNWMKIGDARAKSKPLRKVTRDADDVRLIISFLQKDGEVEVKDGDLFLILDKPS